MAFHLSTHRHTRHQSTLSSATWGLECVVTMVGPSLAQRHACLDSRADMLFGLVDFFGHRQHFAQRTGRNHHQAIAIAAQPIIRLYPHAAQRHGRLDRLNTHPILAGAHPVTPGKDRVIKLQRTVDIAADTVNHRPGQLLTGGGRGQQVAPHGGVEPRLVVDHHHLAGLKVVDVVPHRTAIPANRAVAQGPGFAGEIERAIQGHDAGALANDFQAVHRIAEVGATQGVQTGKNRGLHGVAFLVSDRLKHAGGVTECMDLVDDLARCRLIAVVVLPAICGVNCAQGMPVSGYSNRSFSRAKVSMATALICLGNRRMKAASWCSSTIPPRAVLIRIEPGRICRNSEVPNKPRVSVVSGTWIETMCASASNCARFARRSSSRLRATCSVKRSDPVAITLMPSAAALRATCRAMLPVPTSPSVSSAYSGVGAKVPFAQWPLWVWAL